MRHTKQTFSQMSKFHEHNVGPSSGKGMSAKMRKKVHMVFVLRLR